ncbi:hypothetical protein GGU10DRAFT_329885 [Lentinula aff. detonsa]|uniref:Uncharacterized protein n=1 Tax=Lentinula aff. detonsa TaxID=2804958 RepID=A0AA38TYD3_9AGAR|nr:hypothetical protein GGU10DRAFT_329885 [Lentinula aff. detonsa]
MRLLPFLPLHRTSFPLASFLLRIALAVTVFASPVTITNHQLERRGASANFGVYVARAYPAHLVHTRQDAYVRADSEVEAQQVVHLYLINHNNKDGIVGYKLSDNNNAIIPAKGLKREDLGSYALMIGSFTVDTDPRATLEKLRNLKYLRNQAALLGIEYITDSPSYVAVATYVLRVYGSESWKTLYDKMKAARRRRRMRNY